MVKNPIQNNFLIGVVGAVVCVTIAAASYITATGDGNEAIVTLMFANLATIIPAIAALTGVTRANKRLNEVDRKTDDILNGAMDAKIRRALAHVLDNHLDGETPRERAARVERDR